MSIVPFPKGRFTPAVERSALRQGLPAASRLAAALQLVNRQTAASAYCASCAAPIDFGAVWRGQDAFCSVECSLGGGRPA